MKKILISGGPVFAKLDDVKIITNRFKGGLMADLVDKFIKINGESQEDNRVNIIYLCSKDSKHPTRKNCCEIVYHDGIDDYMDKVLELAPKVDAVVLGAAVANLIPKNKIIGKFPSHKYKPGDTIPIEFTIAPRIIDQVKKVNSKVHLFGFKLLSGVDYYELIRASYGVLLESKAVTVFANDAKNLNQIYAVTKERGVHQFERSEIPNWIIDRINEEYYKTIIVESDFINKMSAEIEEAKNKLKDLINFNANSFIKTEEGYIFGSASLRFTENKSIFVTTARGKREVDDIALVNKVDHKEKIVYCLTNKKATLNAPLFHSIFSNNKEVIYILHFHHQREDLRTLEYATPGTDKDSFRGDFYGPSFNIKGHGCILSYGKNGRLLK